MSIQAVTENTAPQTRVLHTATLEKGTFLGINKYGHARVQWDGDVEGFIDGIALGDDVLIEVAS